MYAMTMWSSSGQSRRRWMCLLNLCISSGSYWFASKLAKNLNSAHHMWRHRSWYVLFGFPTPRKTFHINTLAYHSQYTNWKSLISNHSWTKHQKLIRLEWKEYRTSWKGNPCQNCTDVTIGVLLNCTTPPKEVMDTLDRNRKKFFWASERELHRR
jgi:hypothetical protein